MIKKIKFYLQHLDGIWSVPLIFLAFWFLGLLLQVFGGAATGTYDPGFIQPLFLAIAVVVGATNAAIWGLNFTFRGLYRYLYGERKNVWSDGKWRYKRINHSKADWINLKEWQRYIVAFAVFFYYVTAIIAVYLKLV